MKQYGFTIGCGVIVWLGATLFFVLFGDRVLHAPGTSWFYVNTALLLLGTAVLLYGLTLLYKVIDRAPNAALKFGLIGTIVGLLLDTFALSLHQTLFASLSEEQIIAFTVWMSCAYALYLLIPFLLQRKEAKKTQLADGIEI